MPSIAKFVLPLVVVLAGPATAQTITVPASDTEVVGALGGGRNGAIDFDHVTRARLMSDDAVPDGLVAASHALLPVPSYAEVTDLGSGRTVLVRIVARLDGTAEDGIALSPAAWRQLSDAPQPGAVRVRRTNPSDVERDALRAGRTVRERLATPDNLLAVLRKRAADLPVRVASVPASANADQAARKPVSAPAKPIATGGTTTAKASSTFTKSATTGKAGPASASPSSPTSTSPAKPAPARAKTPPSRATPAGGWFVQLGSFANREAAERVATRHGGSVSAGPPFRVRKGPYPTQAAANAERQAAIKRGTAAIVVR